MHGAQARVTFQLFATPRNDLFPQYLRVTPLNDEETRECQKMATDEVCVFSRGKMAENRSVSAQ